MTENLDIEFLMMDILSKAITIHHNLVIASLTIVPNGDIFPIFGFQLDIIKTNEKVSTSNSL